MLLSFSNYTQLLRETFLDHLFCKYLQMWHTWENILLGWHIPYFKTIVPELIKLYDQKANQVENKKK